MITEEELQHLAEKGARGRLPDYCYIDWDAFCPQCGYNLRGLRRQRHVVCPECGRRAEVRIDRYAVDPLRSLLTTSIVSLVFSLASLAFTLAMGRWVALYGLVVVPCLGVAAFLAVWALRKAETLAGRTAGAAACLTSLAAIVVFVVTVY